MVAAATKEVGQKNLVGRRQGAGIHIWKQTRCNTPETLDIGRGVENTVIVEVEVESERGQSAG